MTRPPRSAGALVDTGHEQDLLLRELPVRLLDLVAGHTGTADTLALLFGDEDGLRVHTNPLHAQACDLSLPTAALQLHTMAQNLRSNPIRWPAWLPDGPAGVYGVALVTRSGLYVTGCAATRAGAWCEIDRHQPTGQIYGPLTDPTRGRLPLRNALVDVVAAIACSGTGNE